MLKDLTAVLKKAKEEKRCVPAINVYNLETIQAVLEAASNMQAPIIVSFGEGYLSHAPLDVIASIVRLLDNKIDLPVVLHLDHAKEHENISKALDCGFTSVMYDGSHLSLEMNINNTLQVVNLASSYGASVEGELGYLNPEDGSSTEIYKDLYTQVDEAEKFVNATGIDALAIAVGNAHGVYTDKPHLEFGRIADIANIVDIPLVLHGSSGIPDSDLQQAISLGVAKINVNTEVALAGSAALIPLIQEKKNVRFETLMKNARFEMTKVISKYINVSYFNGKDV